MNDIYFDLETVPGQSPWVTEAIAADIEEACEKVTAPGNYKKQETIDKFLVEEKARIRETFGERHLKTSFDGTRGEIVSIAFAVNDEFPLANCRTREEDEAELIGWFWASLLECIDHDMRSDNVWIGHNVRGFDLPFLYKRSVVLGIKPPLDFPASSGPSDRRVFDTMTEWAGWGQRISQDNLCKALGLPLKEGMSGADVYEYWMADKHQEIQVYNAGDVERVRQIHKRMTFA